MNRTLGYLRILMLVLAGLWPSVIAAQPHPPMTDFTPGPRMIRFLEQTAHEYMARQQALGLSEQQKQALTDLLRDCKKEMWMKEAVLLGIFQELEDKRRYGLLQDNIDYRTANTLTGGIETDELTLFIDTLAKLQGVLTKEQRAKVRQLWQPTLTMRVSQGVTTTIALMSLDGIGRLYNTWQDELRLTEAQSQALRALLTEARAELLRQGTIVDINRVEGDDLALMPDVDPEVLREKMTRTGDLEAVVFNKLFDYSEKANNLLTEEQQKTLQNLKYQHTVRKISGGRGGHYVDSHQPQVNGQGRFDFFLDQIHALRLSEPQIAKLVSLKDESRKATLVNEAKVKGLELDLVAQLDASSSGSSPTEDFTPLLRQLEDLRLQMTAARVNAYAKARQVLTPEQRNRVHSVSSLLTQE